VKGSSEHRVALLLLLLDDKVCVSTHLPGGCGAHVVWEESMLVRPR
jgi:hypothetical protein